MTREIKFRAWDRKKKQFDTCRNGGDILSFSLNYRGVSELSPKGYKVYQQYTGLKDKNGKEIYEGDCVYAEPVRDGGGEFYIVSWASNGRWYLQNKEANKDSGDLVVQKLEIIGNIYENPELLSNPQ